MNEPKPRDIMSETPRTDAILPIGSAANPNVQHVAIELAGLARQLERALTQAQARCAEIEKAAAEFIVRHDVIAPALSDVFTFYAVHGMKWPDADNWKRELDALRDALKG